MSVSNSQLLKMSDQQTLKFITQYADEDVLWNTMSEKYRDRETRMEAASRIAAAMAIPGFGPEHVITKFKNLRSSYCQEIKKIGVSMKTAITNDDIYEPKVIWFTKMNSFLRPFVTSRTFHGGFAVPEVTLEYENYETGHSVTSDDFENEPSSVPRRSGGISADGYEDPVIKCERLTPTAMLANPIGQLTVSRKRRLAASDPAEQSILGEGSYLRLQGVSQHHRHGSEDASERAGSLGPGGDEDCFEPFGRYIATLLRALPRQRAFVLQQQIVNLALNANIEQESRK